MLADSPNASALGSTSPETPVLSARRAPEVLTGPVAERRIAPELETWVAEAPADTCLVVEGSGSTLFTHNGDLPVPGASLQKIVTGTAALISQGADSRFETVAAATADVGEGGVLAGDLYVIGGGDPLLSTAGYGNQLQRGGELLHDLEKLADAIQDAGVTNIQGSVIGDESRYDTARYHPAWPERFRGQNQIGPISALNVNDGFSDFPAEYGGLASMVQSDDPAANAARVVTDLLGQRGITVDGPSRTGEAPENVTPVATLPSPPLSDIVAETLTNSDNDTAEMLFKEIGLQVEDDGSWDSGAVGVTDVLTEAGIPMEGIQVVDGSGLSSENRMTCELIVDLLTHPEAGQHIVQGLAVAGETGTLEDRFAGTEVAGRLRGKTGTLQNVSALSGQVTPLEGGALTFAYITTVPDPGQIPWEQIDRIDRLPEILVNHSDGIDLEQLLPAGHP